MDSENNKGLIIIYGRKSKFTGKGESIGNQYDLCLNHLILKYGENIKTNVVFFEDEGFTGANTNRPEFKHMMQELQTGKYKMLVVYRLDRVSRNVLDFCSLKEKLDHLGVSFVSITENFDTTTPMGNAMMMISSVFAQLERDTIAERIRDNMHELSKTGRWLGGTTPIGYISSKVDSISVDGKKRSLYQLSIDGEHIKIVKLIFSKYLELNGLSKLESYLIANNIKTRNGKCFSRFALSEILKNIVYCKADEDMKCFLEGMGLTIFDNGLPFDGTYAFMSYHKKLQGKTPLGKRKNIIHGIDEWIISIGKHEGIVDGKTWIAVWNLLHKNGFTKRKTYGKTENESLLSGLITCECCGSFMRPKMRQSMHMSHKRNFVYMCELKERSRKGKCNCSNINGIEVDTKVLKTIKEFTTTPSLLKENLNKLIKKTEDIKDNSLDLELQTLHGNLNKIESKIKGLIDRFSVTEKDVLSIISEEIQTLHNKKEDMIRRIDEINQERNKKANDVNAEQLTNLLLNTYDTAWDSLDLNVKRELIKHFITDISSDGVTLTISF